MYRKLSLQIVTFSRMFEMIGKKLALSISERNEVYSFIFFQITNVKLQFFMQWDENEGGHLF